MGAGPTKLAKPVPKPLDLPGGLALGAKITVRPLVHASYRAVSLDWLVTFCQKFPDIAAKKLTAKEVVATVIKPATKDCKTSYVNMILKNADLQESVSRGRAFFYVTYSWDKPFVGMVDELKKHFKPMACGKGPVFVWIDVLADSQYGDPSPELAHVLQLHTEIVEDSESTLLVMDADGASLDELTLFMYDSIGGTWVPPPGRRVERLGNGVCELKIRRVQGYPGRQLQGGRFNRVTSVNGSTGGDMTCDQDLEDAAPTGPLDASKLTEYDEAALILQAFKRYGQAAKFLERALEIREETLGRSHPETLTTCMVLGSLLDKLVGRAKEAAKYRDRALRSSAAKPVEVVGGDDPSQLCSVVSDFDDMLHHQNKINSEKKQLKQKIGIQVMQLESSDKPRAQVLQTLAAAMDPQKTRTAVRQSRHGPPAGNASGFMGLQVLAGLTETNRRILASRGHPDA